MTDDKLEGRRLGPRATTRSRSSKRRTQSCRRVAELEWLVELKRVKLSAATVQAKDAETDRLALTSELAFLNSQLGKLGAKSKEDDARAKADARPLQGRDEPCCRSMGLDPRRRTRR